MFWWRGAVGLDHGWQWGSGSRDLHRSLGRAFPNLRKLRTFPLPPPPWHTLHTHVNAHGPPPPPPPIHTSWCCHKLRSPFRFRLTLVKHPSIGDTVPLCYFIPTLHSIMICGLGAVPASHRYVTRRADESRDQLRVPTTSKQHRQDSSPCLPGLPDRLIPLWL